MKEEDKKDIIDFKSSILVLIPSIILYAFLMYLSAVFWDLGSFTVSQLMTILFIVFILIQVFYTKFIINRYNKSFNLFFEKTEVSMKEQEKIAKLLIRRDLELTRANEELQKLDKMKSEFIGTAAHQLRTPLSGIKWTLSMILNGDIKNKDEQKAFLMKAYESNNRMIGLVNDMLLTDRVDSVNEKYEFIPTSVPDILDSVLFDLLPQINKKNISVHMNNSSVVIPKVNVDSIKIRSVFQNLLENAIKYTNKDGNIILDFSIKNKFLQFCVEDNGIGIPKDQQKNIFNKFFRGENAKRSVADGSGLGLFIVRAIVENHGGKVWFESEENKGTKFYFSLPIK